MSCSLPCESSLEPEAELPPNTNFPDWLLLPGWAAQETTGADGVAVTLLGSGSRVGRDSGSKVRCEGCGGRNSQEKRD